ncbi:MAG: DNA alkylation repair protein [Candidatus Methanoplasma sp.]|jgi:3-methyladenine DNA glycosylase AlkC|nr:DNA alkylation repair protein [Candidatus Methanoplasma sp.]
MPDLLKDMFNQDSLRKLALDVQTVYGDFQADEFLRSAMDETWDDLELKARVRRVSTSLGRHLTSDYGSDIAILDKVVAKHPGFLGTVFPDFVEVYGQDESDWEISMGALERYTRYSSSEFAVRPFIIEQEERMMAQMYAWSKHENEHVRRLSSEGCRPQLPWGQALPKYKKDPTPVLPILEQLKADPSLYVRKSVANNLNDISKTHPDTVIKLAKGWYGKNDRTDWIVKQGCRTLLKKGNPEALAIFGYRDKASTDITDFAQSAPSASIGEDMTFSFSIRAKEQTKVRLEYGIDYVKANGNRNRKIFQISEVTLKKNEEKTYVRNHSFKDMTTRKHYPGMHSIALIVNGVECGKLDFELNPRSGP